jgi:isopenicillin-N epimerase
MRAHWALDPNVLYLNHGTVGCPPRRALEAQQRIRDEIELQPSKFLLRELAQMGMGPTGGGEPLTRIAAREVAAFVGAKGEDFAFVENVTTGVNCVLRSLELREGDEIVLSDLGYGAVANAAAYVTRRARGHVRVVELENVVPDTGAIVRAFEAALTPRTRLVIVDHITSSSALILPVREVVAACQSRGVPVLVDGAHVPGAIALDVPAIGADWYSANLHKWGWTPRSLGFLWVRPGGPVEIHPTVISWGLDLGLGAEFDLLGTRDPSAALAAPAGLAFMRELGTERVMAYNHALAWEAAQLLSARWGTGLWMREEHVGTMATVFLPPGLGPTQDDCQRLRNALLFEDGIEVAVHPFRNRACARISAQVYNQREDYERLARTVLARLAQPA